MKKKNKNERKRERSIQILFFTYLIQQ